MKIQETGMIFSLDVLRAGKGDCLMLHYGSAKDPHLILIDGGPAGVYTRELRPRLELVRDVRKLDHAAPLPIDVVMVSHIDGDHIKGILELTKEQFLASRLRLHVRSLWYNSFDDLLKRKPDQSTPDAGTAATAGGAAASNVDQVLASLEKSGSPGEIDIDLDEDDRSDKENERRNREGHQALAVLASVPQGRKLRDDRVSLASLSNLQQWRLNHKFGGKLIQATDDSEPVILDGILHMTVVGPMQDELNDLHAAHDKWVRKHLPKDMLAAFVDDSVPNLSSIVVLAELDGNKMLLTGDARGDKILEGLKLKRLLDADGNCHVDILKVPHHGSQNNMETGFFKRVTADHYVFSGDGKHGNPERETLEMLQEARGTDAMYTIHLTYRIEEIDKNRQAEWENQQNKEQDRKRENPDSKKKIRDDWSDEKQSLKALFDENPKFWDKVVFVKQGQPHLIDLLDAVKL
jgi:beta-lactamase superfamily II metal-dependent hydrolase